MLPFEFEAALFQFDAREPEFAPLPKTISGKIRRVELRDREVDRHPDVGVSTAVATSAADIEYRIEDFPELR